MSDLAINQLREAVQACAAELGHRLGFKIVVSNDEGMLLRKLVGPIARVDAQLAIRDLGRGVLTFTPTLTFHDPQLYRFLRPIPDVYANPQEEPCLSCYARRLESLRSRRFWRFTSGVTPSRRVEMTDTCQKSSKRFIEIVTSPRLLATFLGDPPSACHLDLAGYRRAQALAAVQAAYLGERAAAVKTLQNATNGEKCPAPLGELVFDAVVRLLGPKLFGTIVTSAEVTRQMHLEHTAAFQTVPE